MRIKWNKSMARGSLTDLTWSGPWPSLIQLVYHLSFLPSPSFCCLLGLFLPHDLSFIVSSARNALPLALCAVADWWLLLLFQVFSFLVRSPLMVSFSSLFYFLNSTDFSLKLSWLFVYLCLVCPHLHLIFMKAKTFCILLMAADPSAYNSGHITIDSQ